MKKDKSYENEAGYIVEKNDPSVKDFEKITDLVLETLKLNNVDPQSACSCLMSLCISMLKGGALAKKKDVLNMIGAYWDSLDE